MEGAEEWEPHEEVDGQRFQPAAVDETDKLESEWTCNICFEDLKIEESCLTSCGRKILL